MKQFSAKSGITVNSHDNIRNRPPSAPFVLANIPPERIGLQGEYDHSGLAKRVQQTLKQHIGEPISSIRVSQRGQVVIIVGLIETSHLMRQLAEIALSVHGAAFVEIHNTDLFLVAA
jgi:hypothetical protein